MKPVPQRLFILAILPIFLALSVLVLWTPAIAGEIINIQIAQSKFQKLNGTWMTEKQSPDSDSASECLFDWKIDKAVISGENMSLFLTGKNKQQVVSGKINTEKMDFDADRKLSIEFAGPNTSGFKEIYVQFAGIFKGDRFSGWICEDFNAANMTQNFNVAEISPWSPTR